MESGGLVTPRERLPELDDGAVARHIADDPITELMKLREIGRGQHLSPAVNQQKLLRVARVKLIRVFQVVGG